MDVLCYISEDGLVEIKIAANSVFGAWRRFKSRIGEEATRYSDYSSTHPGSLFLIDLPNQSTQLVQIGEGSQTLWPSEWPVMFETCVYTFSLRFQGIEGEPQIVHSSKEVVERFSCFSGGNGVAFLSGSVDFLNEPGKFSLRYRYKPVGEPERTGCLDFQVVSPKLDTKRDYLHILNKVNEEYENLVFKFLTKTYQGLQRGGKSNDLIWLSIFKSIVADYILAITYIVNKPHFRVERRVYQHRADAIKHWSPLMAERLNEAAYDDRLESMRFRNEVKESTIDTRENRFVKFTLQSISGRINKVLGELCKAYEDQLSAAEKAELTGYSESLKRLARNSLFRRVGRFEGFRQESNVLQKRTGYAQVYRAWHILNSGLSLYSGATDIGVRPIWELYELWCFIKMKRMIAEILGLEFDDEHITQERPDGFDPFRDNQMEHIVTYYPESGDRVELRYQHTYNRFTGEVHTATTEQRPDIVLNIIKPDGFTLTYLYDAKYRVLDDRNAGDMDNPDADYADYPPSDAINQMHRYRDAIYYGSGREDYAAKEIIGGFILFPGRATDAKIKERYFYKSIESVNIGAFPLLPDVDHPEKEGWLLREHLTSVLIDRSRSQQIEDSIPQRGLSYIPVEAAKREDLVLVGYIKDKATEHVILDQLVYYVPSGFKPGSIELVYGFDKAKYLLLHDAQKNRKMYELSGYPPNQRPLRI